MDKISQAFGNDKAQHVESQATSMVILLAGSAILVVHFLFTHIFPQTLYPASIFGRTWGIDALTYFPVWAQVLAYAIALIVLLPGVTKIIISTIKLLFSRETIGKVSERKQELFILISILSVPLFWFFSSKYAFLGDSHLRVGNVLRKDFLIDELATIYLMHYVHRMLNAVLKFDGMATFIAISCACGGIFVYLALRIADSLGSGIFRKTAIFLFIILFGTIQQFCGYIEIYAISMVLLAAYVYTAILCLDRRLPVFIPGLLLAAAIFCHLISMMFFPSFLLVLYLSVIRPKFKSMSNPRVLAAIVAAAALCAWFPFQKFVLPRMYPLIETAAAPGQMTLFSVVHFWEFLNGQILSSGIALPLLMFSLWMLIFTRKAIDFRILFLFSAWFFPLAGIFSFNLLFGSADWDLSSFASLAGQPLAIYLFIRIADARGWDRNLPQVLVAACVFMLLHTAPWVLVNASDLSIKRFEKTISTDPATYFITHPAPMFLAIVLETNGIHNRAFDYYQKAYERHPSDVRMKYNFANKLLGRGKHDEAMKLFKDLYEQSPQYTLPLKTLYEIFQRNGDPAMALTMLRRLFEVYRSNAAMVTPFYQKQELAYYFGLFCNDLTKKNQLQDALPVCSTLVAIEPANQSSRYLLAALHMDLGNADAALNACLPLVNQQPPHEQALLLAAKANQMKGNHEDALRILELCAVNARDQNVRSAAEREIKLLQTKSVSGKHASKK